MSDKKFQSPPAGYPEGNPPLGYPTQPPPPQYAEAAEPVKTQTSAKKGWLAALCCCFACEECC